MRKIALALSALLVGALWSIGDAKVNPASAQSVQQREMFFRDALFPAGAKAAAPAPAKKAKKAKAKKKAKKKA